MDTTFFVAKKLLSALLSPPLLPWVPVALALLLWRWHPRSARLLCVLGLLLGLALSSPLLLTPVLRALEDAPPLHARALTQAQAIVVLAGGRRAYAPEFGGESISRLSLERLRYGARLARQSGLPLLLSGGAPSGGTAEARLLQRALQDDFGLSARWLETRSRDTHENAAFSAPLLRAARIQRIALVTHAAHMKRAQKEFEAQGIEVVAAPTAYFSGPPGADEVIHVLPSGSSAFAGYYAWHEYLGLAAQWLSR